MLDNCAESTGLHETLPFLGLQLVYMSSCDGQVQMLAITQWFRTLSMAAKTIGPEGKELPQARLTANSITGDLYTTSVTPAPDPEV